MCLDAIGTNLFPGSVICKEIGSYIFNGHIFTSLSVYHNNVGNQFADFRGMKLGVRSMPLGPEKPIRYSFLPSV